MLSKSRFRNKSTVVSLRVKIGHKLNYSHHIKLYYHITFATFGAMSSPIFPCYVCLEPMLSKNMTKTFLLLVPLRYLS